MKNRRGQVLVHVLITTVIVSVIAAGLAQMLLLRYAANARATDGASKRAMTQQALSQAISAWNAGGNSTCSSPGAGWSLTSGGANTCNCAYTNNTTSPKIRIVAVGPGGSPCPLATPAALALTACTQNDDGTTWPAGCP